MESQARRPEGPRDSAREEAAKASEPASIDPVPDDPEAEPDREIPPPSGDAREAPGAEEVGARSPSDQSALQAWASESLRRAEERREATVEEEPTESTPSLHGYHEWHLQRLQRRVRLLTWALVALLALLAIGGTYLFTTEQIAPATSARSGTAEEQGTQIQRLQNQLTSLEEARRTDASVLEPLAASLGRMRSAIRQLDRRQSAGLRCMSRSLAAFDESLRDVLQRRMSPEAFVQRPRLGRCSA